MAQEAAQPSDGVSNLASDSEDSHAEQQHEKDQQDGYYQDQFGYHVGTTIIPRTPRKRCRNCATTFTSNNKLHAHLKRCRPNMHGDIGSRTPAEPAIGTRSKGIAMIKSKAAGDKSNGLAF